MVSGALTMIGQDWSMAVQGIRGVVEAAIQRASESTGVDFSFLMRTANRESSMNPHAKAPSSSAAGLFQFVEQTWLATLKQHGAKYGYARYADLISKGADGRYHVGSPGARRAVMDLRLDPQAASLMAGELASGHAAYLRGRVGRAPTEGELYAAHFLGPQGSARLIEAADRTPQAAAASLFPDAAAANRSIFYRNGRPATVAELYANLTSIGGRSVSRAAAPDSDDGDASFIKYAAARNQEHAREQALISLILGDSGSADLGLGDRSGGGRLTGSLFTTEMLRVLSEASNDKKG